MFYEVESLDFDQPHKRKKRNWLLKSEIYFAISLSISLFVSSESEI